MNIIQQDGRTKDYLQSWAGDTQLIYNSFFFWRSGSQQLQHTLEGLLRTMLYKCLQDAPGLKDVVLSSLVGRSPRPHKYHWSLSELMQCFNRLLTQATVKIALFIDGLDEYSGNYVDLIKLLRTLPRSTDVKICLSSRPETPFVTAFGSSPGLRLQYITQGDISSYIVHRLGEDFSPLSPPHSAHEFSLRQLIGREMVRTANGVFQLVVAVATAVEIDIYEGESDRELWYHIERLPEDLDSLYLQMLEAIKPYRRKQMAQVFILIQTCRSYRTLRAEVLWSSPLLLDKTEREAIEATPTLSPSSSSSRALPFSQDQERLAGSHLQNISRGLLEMNSNKKVQYSHKSVEDFLRLPSTQSWLKQHLPRYGDLEVFQQWLAMTVLHIKWYRRDFFEAQELVHAAFSWAAELTKQQKYPRGALLQELDRVLSLTYVEYLDDLVGSGQLSKERHDVWIEYHWSSAALCRYRTVLPMNQNDAITVLVSCNPLEASLPNESSELVFLTVACWYKLHDVVSGVLEATSDHSLRVQKAKSLMGSFLHFCESEAYVTTLEPFLKTTILLAENGGYVRHDGPGLHPFAHWVVKLWELFIVSGEIAASRSVLDVSRSVIASLLAQSGIANEKTWVASYSAYPVFPFVRLNFAEILNAMGFCDASEPHRAIVSSEVFNLPKRPFPDVWQRPVFVYKDQNDWPARALSSLEEVRDCMELEDFGFDQDFHFDVDYKILSLRFAHGNYCLSDSGGSTEREGKTSNDETTLRNLFEDAVFGLIWGDVEDCQSFNLEYFDDIG